MFETMALALLVAQVTSAFENLKFRSIGPAAGGRVTRAVGVDSDPRVYYAATASGGVWKSTDGGIRWSPIMDDQPVSSIGSIAVAPSDPNVVYVGAGEANIRGNVAAGNGIYRSTDAGKSWEHVLVQEGQIGTMEVHPTNPAVAFAAVLGHAFGPNEERGVYRTTDGGTTWQRVLYIDEDTGASDVSIDASNPRIVFAGMWEARRSPWSLTSGGEQGGIYVTRDGGESWEKLEHEGLPSGVTGKIAVDVAPSDGRTVYALIEAEEGGLYRSRDGGESWTRVNGESYLLIRPWYFTHLTIDPTNPDVVWAPSLQMLKSIDGGVTFKRIQGIHHGDHHDLWIDPHDPSRMIASNDGGVDVSVDAGESWYAPALPISQFYRVNVDNRTPYHVHGNMQDLGTASGPSNSLSERGITRYDWHGVGGGETGHSVSDPRDPDVVYAGEYFGYLSRYDHETRQARNISIYPMDTSGQGASELRYRFQWTAPVHLSYHDPNVLYHGSQFLMKTTDAGLTWAAVSPDLTRNDADKQKFSGGPITGDNTGVEIYGTIFAIGESPVRRDLIWIGSDDGLVHVSLDGGAEWRDVTPPDLPEWSTVKTIEASRFSEGTAYMVAERHRLDDMSPYLFKTADYGSTWQSLSGTMDQHVYLHTVREDPEREGMLYVGTETGVVYSKDHGKSWEALKLNLPTVAVHELRVKDGDLVVGTHGRSIWIFDDLTPIREMSPSIEGEEAHLFSVRPGVRFRYHGGPRDIYGGDNPPQGAMLHYYLANEPEEEIRLRILTAGGDLVRTYSSHEEEPEGTEDTPDVFFRKLPEIPKKKGVNRFSWDLRYDGARIIPAAEIDMGDPREGAFAPPGEYLAELTVGERVVSQELVVRPDPRGSPSVTDLEEQLRFSLSIRDTISTLTDTVVEIRALREQLESARARYEEIAELSTSILERCDELEKRLHNPGAKVAYDILATPGGAKLYSKLGPLMDYVNEGDGAPTQGMREVYEELRLELEDIRSEWNDVVTSRVAEWNARARELELPHIVPPAGR
ncbi:MAG TPA: glycosyl hydrolase [Vicinamibacteria bacterium]|nr:glycosyl hydrolase [Vicinamibacteria bacterium]